ncbi:unnamed protein product [Chironomus riparius]|uniref:Gamma-glutamyltransferase n=1 Tax=Chironomus riparius TaxID=315576 RepID=A0A9N9RT29_9DIPT|nr:unnamed protein product [Chironomus riparius]
MAIIKRRSRRSKDFLDRKFFRQNKYHANSEQHAPQWKIFCMLIFLMILIVLLLKNDEPDHKEHINKRNIPDPEKSLPPSSSQLYTFKHAAVSSDSQACSDIARNLLRENENGNIFDATISTLICNGMTNIQSTGLFGGFLLTAYIPSEQKSVIIDAQMVSPKNFPLRVENFDTVKHGGMAIAVPGFLKGIWEMHKKFAKLTWKEILIPLIDLCKTGIIMTKHLRDSIDFNERILNDTYLRDLFIERSSGKVKRIGTKIILNKQCNFLELLSNHNDTGDIFTGSIGEMIVNDLKQVNSIITIDDLKSYNVKIYDGRIIDINDNHAIVVPNSLALLIPSILKTLMRYNFNASSWFEGENFINNTILTHHRIIETFKYAFAMRSRFGDPDFIDISDVTDYLLSEKFTNYILKSINDTSVKPNIDDYGLNETIPQNHGTSHISIVTENRDSVSVTSSINYYFGAGITGEKSGLIFNNGMDDFSFPGRDLNYFGLKETATNYQEAGKRALSSISPVIVIDKKTRMPQIIIGAAGGSKISSALTIAILRFLCCSNDLKEIIDAPRFHHQLVPNIFEYEYGITSNVIEGLMLKGHATYRYRNRGTIINALALDERNVYAISDYRKDHSGVAGF